MTQSDAHLPANGNDDKIDPAPVISPRQINQVEYWRWLLLWPLAAIAKIWTGTLRFRVDFLSWERCRVSPKPIILLIWHNRLFMAAEVRRRYLPTRPLSALISASKDGAWLAAFFSLVGIKSIRGSSSWRGTQALRELLGMLRRGEDVALTPDGPRGPCYSVTKSALLLARRHEASLMVVGMNPQVAWRLKSWDGFILPRPFTQVDMASDFYETWQELLDANPAESEELSLKMAIDRVTHDRMPAPPSGGRRDASEDALQ